MKLLLAPEPLNAPLAVVKDVDAATAMKAVFLLKAFHCRPPGDVPVTILRDREERKHG